MKERWFRCLTIKQDGTKIIRDGKLGNEHLHLLERMTFRELLDAWNGQNFIDPNNKDRPVHVYVYLKEEDEHDCDSQESKLQDGSRKGFDFNQLLRNIGGS